MLWLQKNEYKCASRGTERTGASPYGRTGNREFLATYALARKSEYVLRERGRREIMELWRGGRTSRYVRKEEVAFELDATGAHLTDFRQGVRLTFNIHSKGGGRPSRRIE